MNNATRIPHIFHVPNLYLDVLELYIYIFSSGVKKSDGCENGARSGRPSGDRERDRPVLRQAELGGVEQNWEVEITTPAAMDLKVHPLKGQFEKEPPEVKRGRASSRSKRSSRSGEN
ncbi:MAG: hypothetical protein WA761_04095 [Thermoplasmata archaeon]